MPDLCSGDLIISIVCVVVKNVRKYESRISGSVQFGTSVQFIWGYNDYLNITTRYDHYITIQSYVRYIPRPIPIVYWGFGWSHNPQQLWKYRLICSVVSPISITRLINCRLSLFLRGLSEKRMQSADPATWSLLDRWHTPPSSRHLRDRTRRGNRLWPLCRYRTRCWRDARLAPRARGSPRPQLRVVFASWRISVIFHHYPSTIYNLVV